MVMKEEGNKIETKVFNFNRYIQKNQLTIYELYKKIIAATEFKHEFYFCIIHDLHISCYINDSMEFYKEFCGFGDDLNDVEEVLKRICSIEEARDISYLQFLDIEVEDGKSYYIYYLSVLRDFAGINRMYLNVVNDVYGNWLQDIYRRFPAYSKVFVRQDVEEKNRNRMSQWLEEINRKVRSDMHEKMGVDLDVINKISGYYYERKECSSEFCVLLENINLSYEVKYTEEIPMKDVYVNMIRKVFEMVQENQCLVFGTKDENCSNIRVLGIARKEECNRNINFKIKGHMYWVMELNDEVVMSYKYGQYIIEHNKFRLKEFEEKYIEIFGMSDVRYAKEIVEEALQLGHGSALIFLDAENTEGMERLNYANSIGFEWKSKDKLSKKKLKNLSAIDGAIMLDKECRCLKYGMMLNSKQQTCGKLERGSRFNSTLNYIQNCFNEGVDAVGVVISDDKTVDIIVGK